MHEFTLLKDLLRKIESVAKEDGSDKVLGVTVWLGALSHISADHFREHFDQAVKGTIIDGANLDIETSGDTKDPRAQEIVLKSVEVSQ
jgi:hydrogenase nickel incorporation protein HypA/HybF